MTRIRTTRGYIKSFITRTLLLALASSTLLWASQAAADYTLIPERFTSCTTCHGVELKGNRAMNGPRITGLAAWYVRRQLQFIQSGQRGSHDLEITGQEMRPQTLEMSADDIVAAADFVASMPRQAARSESRIEGDVGRGRSLYQTCAVCHGDRGQGDENLQAPALSGQSDWYLIDQLVKFESGSRGYASGDTPGQQMRAAIASLKEDSWATDVVAYINTLNNH